MKCKRCFSDKNIKENGLCERCEIETKELKVEPTRVIAYMDAQNILLAEKDKRIKELEEENAKLHSKTLWCYSCSSLDGYINKKSEVEKLKQCLSNIEQGVEELNVSDYWSEQDLYEKFLEIIKTNKEV